MTKQYRDTEGHFCQPKDIIGHDGKRKPIRADYSGVVVYDKHMPTRFWIVGEMYWELGIPRIYKTTNGIEELVRDRKNYSHFNVISGRQIFSRIGGLNLSSPWYQAANYIGGKKEMAFVDEVNRYGEQASKNR